MKLPSEKHIEIVYHYHYHYYPTKHTQKHQKNNIFKRVRSQQILPKSPRNFDKESAQSKVSIYNDYKKKDKLSFKQVEAKICNPEHNQYLHEFIQKQNEKERIQNLVKKQQRISQIRRKCRQRITQSTYSPTLNRKKDESQQKLFFTARKQNKNILEQKQQSILDLQFKKSLPTITKYSDRQSENELLRYKYLQQQCKYLRRKFLEHYQLKH